MKHLLLIASILAPLPAWAIADQDNSAISQQQAQQQAQVAKAAAAAQQRQTATGGAGGSAHATGGKSSSSAAGGAVTVTNSYSGGVADPAGGYVGYAGVVRQAPDVVIPSVGGGGADCPVVGFGVGGSGIGGGGGFGPSWISSDCNARKLASMLQQMGYTAAAVALLQDHFPEVRKAMQQQPALPPAPPADPFIVGFCVDNPTLCDGSE